MKRYALLNWAQIIKLGSWLSSITMRSILFAERKFIRLLKYLWLQSYCELGRRACKR